MTRAHSTVIATRLAALLVCAGFALGCGRYAPPIRPEPPAVPAPQTAPAADEPAPEGWEFEDEPGSEAP